MRGERDVEGGQGGDFCFFVCMSTAKKGQRPDIFSFIIPISYRYDIRINVSAIEGICLSVFPFLYI